MMSLSSMRMGRAALLATLILIGQGVIYYNGSGKEVIPVILPWNQFPPEVNQWKTLTDIPIAQDVLDKLRPDDYLNRNYASPGERTSLNFFIGYFNFPPERTRASFPGMVFAGPGGNRFPATQSRFRLRGKPSRWPRMNTSSRKVSISNWCFTGTTRERGKLPTIWLPRCMRCRNSFCMGAPTRL